ncbi:DUF1801 domain-containing protein [Alkalibacter sp. M17DMB]|nr:DUF1801 domain-containing protein [Alkalibacter mobilis]
MKIEAKSVQEYMEKIPEERREVMSKLRDFFNRTMPKEIVEVMSYGMIAYCVDKKVDPRGYHVNPHEPLPVVSIASQKNHIAIYHMPLYMFPELMDWFQTQYKDRYGRKLDAGKSCLRFKRPELIPFDMLEELADMWDLGSYIARYEEKSVN